MASAGACEALNSYATYINAAPANSNQSELPQDEEYEVDYNSPYLNSLLQPALNPHEGVLPNTSRSYLQHAYLDGDNVHMDLSILGSETHNDGRVVEEMRDSSRAGAHGNSATLSGALVPKRDVVDSEVQSSGRSRKKSRIHSQGSDDEAASKKARGRPRVDTTDETAADRRRTQIRLAQRAYRQRKETTISSLKGRVSELQSAIEEANKSFLKFNDNAMSSGIIQSRPDLARDLRDATEQFLSLARIANSNQDNSFDEEMEESGGRDRENALEGKPKTSTRRGTAKRLNRIPPVTEKPNLDTWGYQVTRERQPLNKNRKRPSEPSPGVEPQHDEFRGGFESTDTSRSPISTTSETRFEEVRPLQLFHAEMPSPDHRYPDAFDSQQAALPIPWTLSYQETSFARRLHRAAIERGYYLLLSPNSPPSEVTRVFQFCFTFSDRNETLRRLHGMLTRSNKETLSHWQAPILHIGGAGLHYPRKGGSKITEAMRRDLTAPVRSIGPMALALAKGAKEKGVTPEMMIKRMGLDGEWFDSDDVEGYLLEKGVVFNGNPSFVEMEVLSPGTPDTASAATPLSPGFSSGSSGNSSSTNGHSSPSELSLSYDYNNNGGQDFDFRNDILFHDAVAADPFANSVIPENNLYFNPNVEKQLRHGNDNMYTPADPFRLSPHMQAGANVTSIPHTLNVNNAANVEKRGGRRKMVVTIDLAVLVEELVNVGRCLGRAPGFRKEDVDEAIRVATMSMS